MAVNLWIDSLLHRCKFRTLKFIHCNSQINSHRKSSTVKDLRWLYTIVDSVITVKIQSSFCFTGV
jgi:hypothetical protein